MADTKRRDGNGAGRPGRAGRSVPRPARPPAPPAPPVDPAVAERLNRLVRTFVLLIIGALLTAMLALPWRLGSLALAVAAIVVGVVALRRAWRPGLREQVAPLLVFGLAFAVLMSMSMAGTLILWPVEVAHQECLGRAVTIGARAECEQTYQDALQERLDNLMRRP